ncbi:mechanosensitive ion channel protein MscL [Mycoplasmopsis californica]|uniref:Mechanosensitive ion channel protein MscL n=2 Tax=Mycoplasmopsis californica TaxID=2113 RepID=A0A059XRC3_9BACT|nr:MscL family protein [Mycoplasmopsis californica]AIA29323.1 mechanosensitive ion channel protein MscL [Mycoplasmopsis californica]
MFRKASKDAWAVVKRSNMLMLAIGLLLGAAFNEVVKSLANDVIMPPIAQLARVKDVEQWKWGSVLIGKFLSALIAFIIVSFIIYVLLMVVFLIKAKVDFKKLLKLKKEEEEVVPEPTTQELILLELQKLNETIKEQKEQE